MGTAGSGKSTLTNGMVNYFRVFQWKDPFRFKCIHEDDLINRFQVNNKTNSVTTHKLRYQEKICLFRIRSRSSKHPATATRGARRDKEITRKIQPFFTQMNFRIGKIHDSN